MRKHILIYFLFINIATSGIYVVSSAKTSGSTPKAYISQTMIDTSIQRAFYILNEATSIAGVGFRQQQAIAEAKAIAKRLRTIASGDKNERYILWKVSELESQIYLEEKDIMLLKMQQGQISINQLVSRYNTEVGKSRPDFASMRRMHVQMGQLDVNQANQMADSYNQRYRAITREVTYALEQALENGELDKAQSELGYCLRNASYLSMGEATYNQLERKVEKLAVARVEKPKIEQELATANASLRKNDLISARDNLTSAEGRYTQINTTLPERESSFLYNDIRRYKNQLSTKEDSLVNVNLNILSKKGINAADEYLRNTLRTLGVSRDKVAFVDKAILDIKSPDNSGISDEISSISAGNEDEQEVQDGSSDGNAPPTMLDEIMARARKKAQEKTDSLRRIEEAQMRIAMAEQRRQDSIAAVQRAAELKVFEQKQTIAKNTSMDIYALLEKNQIQGAGNKFQKERPYLLQYLDKNDFYILESTLQQFSAPPPPQPVQTVAANTPTVRTSKQSSVQNVQPVNVSGPMPAAIEEKLRKNQERAETEISEIYSLLEKNQVNEAYARFQKNRKPLQMFLQQDIFSLLENTVSQAWEFQQGMQ
jgi:hypothetical protein